MREAVFSCEFCKVPRSGRAPSGAKAPRTRRVMLDSCGACKFPLRDASCADELGAREPVVPRVATQRDGRRCFIELPARRLVSAGRASQEHSILLELQQGVVTMQAAIHLSQPIDHATAKTGHVRVSPGRRAPVFLV